MEFYSILFAFVAMLGTIDFFNVKKTTKIICIYVISITSIVFAASIYHMGHDWIAYLAYFEENNTLAEFSMHGFEYGFVILNYVVKNCFENYNILLFIIATIVIFIKARFIIKYSPFIMCAFVLNYANNVGDISSFRQIIALVFLLISFDYIVKRKIGGFLIWVLIAFLFHRTALLFLPAFYLYNLRLSRKQLAIYLILSIGIGLSGIVENLILFILNNIGDQGAFIGRLYEYYLTAQQGDAHGKTISMEVVIMLALIKRGLLIPIFIIYKEKFSKINFNYNGILNIVIFGHCFFFLLINTIPEIASRASGLYVFFEVLLVPYIFYLFKDIRKILICYILFIAYCYVKYVYNITTFEHVYIPYYTIFDRFF